MGVLCYSSGPERTEKEKQNDKDALYVYTRARQPAGWAAVSEAELGGGLEVSSEDTGHLKVNNNIWGGAHGKIEKRRETLTRVH